MPPEPEREARKSIDALLIAAGWAVQDYAAFNPAAARGIALREVPLVEGRCDYLLMVDRAAVGIIEAKKEGTLLSGVAEQSAFYAGQLPSFLQAKANPRFFYERQGQPRHLLAQGRQSFRIRKPAAARRDRAGNHGRPRIGAGADTGNRGGFERGN